MEKVGTPSEYAEAMCRMIKNGVNIGYLNMINHQALVNGQISMEHFRLAARELAKVILER